MEAFLTTLPPYVHDFLNKYPPTDVFNLLRELISFAVLYSDDRDRINQSTQEFLKKRDQQTTELESVEEEQEEEQTTVEQQDAVVPIQDSVKSPNEKPKLPNTFPQWWGHHEFQAPEKPVQKPVVEVQKPVEVQKKPVQEKKPTEDLPQSVGPAWISWDTPTQTNMRRMEKARSQIIPDLRSYLEEDHTRMSAVRNSSPTPTKKRHSMLNLKTSTSPPTNKTLVKTKETTTVTSSPVSVTPPTKLTPQKAPSRSTSVNLSQPRQNAAMRARAEHARLQQAELEKKKSTPPPGSSISLKLKQRVNSGIDWDTIKKERRKTLDNTTTK